MKHCIYQILNLVNGKFYIGHSQDYDVRWWEHERCLRKNRHENQYLQAAYNKYGTENIEFILIELVDEKDMLIREQFWIDKLGACDRELGYNLNPDVFRPPTLKGKKKSKETCTRISIATTGIPKRPHTRKPHTEEHKRKLSFAKRAISDWPCPEGCFCSCDICRPRRNRMKNYPKTYGNSEHELYRK